MLTLACLVRLGVAGLAVVTVAAGPTGTEDQAPFGETCAERVFKGVSYASTSPRTVLDLYRPRGSTSNAPPVVIWLHPGGWAGGSRESVRLWALRLVCRGYAVAAVDYRLSEEALFPAQVHDLKAAVRFLRREAPRFGIDAERIAVWGASAGAHLASLLGTTHGVPVFDAPTGVAPPVSSRVSAVVDWWGPTDFSHMDHEFPPVCSTPGCHDCPESPESRLLGCNVSDCPERAREASPLTHVTADDPPFLIQHGSHDCTVPYRQGLLLQDVLDAAGVTVTFDLVPGAGHGDGHWSRPEVLGRVDEFLDTHLGGRGRETSAGATPSR